MEITTKKRLQILSGSHNGKLAQAVAKHIDVPLSDMKLDRFANGEISVKLGESARGADVFVFSTHDQPVNDAIMEQLIIIDAAKRASAKRITAVCPYFGYARQDRKSSGREPITAKLLVDMLTAAGADRIVSVDLHTGQIQGFFDGPFDHLTALPVLSDYIRDQLGGDVVIVSPDAGRVKTSERYVRRLGADFAIIHKTRSKTQANTVEAKNVIGEVAGRRCVLIDDMIDTAGTICAAAQLLKESGAAEIYAMATHGILSDPALERLAASPIDRIVVTDTLPLPEGKNLDKVEVVSVVPLVAAAIKAIYLDESVSKIFGGENHI
ncbi:MAG TPA: ribose-phosphate diphosphokinase [Candidatus Saccharimonadia bacterium]|nr:ribose-phosphate diphosphokinase [Candidatus Saccharimonadia bacterium]